LFLLPETTFARGGEMVDYSAVQQAVIDGDDEKTVQLVKEALEQDLNPADIVASGLQAAMSIVGSKFSSGEFFVPEMLLAARAVTKALEVLRPRLLDPGTVTIGRVVIGTVAGDIHDIGKNLVSMFLQGAGFEVIDLGTDVSAQSFVAAVKEHNPDILGMSALLTTTMPGMQATIEALESAGIRRQVKVVVGGGPVTQHFADRIGADGYGADGGAAIELCRKLIKE
jgi:5-methyltetrahydrofolate--homocysteine methyltransferase